MSTNEQFDISRIYTASEWTPVAGGAGVGEGGWGTGQKFFWRCTGDGWGVPPSERFPRRARRVNEQEFTIEIPEEYLEEYASWVQARRRELRHRMLLGRARAIKALIKSGVPVRCISTYWTSDEKLRVSSRFVPAYAEPWHLHAGLGLDGFGGLWKTQVSRWISPGGNREVQLVVKDGELLDAEKLGI